MLRVIATLEEEQSNIRVFLTTAYEVERRWD
jgi:hypothetical protein